MGKQRRRGEGSIITERDPQGQIRYKVALWDPVARKQRTVGRRRSYDEAQELLRDSQPRVSGYLATPRQRPTVAEYFQLWLAEKRARGCTPRGDVMPRTPASPASWS